MKRLIMCFLAGVALSVLLAPFGFIGCSSGKGSSVKSVVEDAAVKLGVDLCKEELVDSGMTGDEIAVLCETGGKIVRVILPRKAWYGMKAGAGDAGPGK